MSADFCIVLVRSIPSCSKWPASFFDAEPNAPIIIIIIIIIIITIWLWDIYLQSVHLPFQLVRAHFHEKRHGYQAKQNGELWQVTLLNSSALEF